MRKRIKIQVSLMAALLFTALLPAVNLMADTRTYTLTVRAGNVGVFDTEKYASVDGLVEVTENYIKYQIPRGKSMTEQGYTSGDAQLNALFRSIVKTEESYSLRTIKGLADKKITKNTDYVLDYGKLVEPVPYSIYYVDAVSGEQIAAPTLSYGNKGDVIADIVPLALAGYESTDTAVSLTLDADAENSVTFSYTNTEKTEEIVTEKITYLPGDTVTILDVNERYQEMPPVAEANEGENTVIPNEEVPLDGGNADEEVVIPDEEVPLGGENEDEVAVIPDEEVPLGGGNADEEEIIIEDEEVPLAGGNLEKSPLWLIGGISAVTLAAATTVVFVRRKRLSKEPEKNDTK